jgi:hypothetical protein
MRNLKIVWSIFNIRLRDSAASVLSSWLSLYRNIAAVGIEPVTIWMLTLYEDYFEVKWKYKMSHWNDIDSVARDPLCSTNILQTLDLGHHGCGIMNQPGSQCCRESAVVQVGVEIPPSHSEIMNRHMDKMRTWLGTFWYLCVLLGIKWKRSTWPGSVLRPVTGRKFACVTGVWSQNRSWAWAGWGRRLRGTFVFVINRKTGTSFHAREEEACVRLVDQF